MLSISSCRCILCFDLEAEAEHQGTGKHVFRKKEALIIIMYVIRFIVVLFFQTFSAKYFLNVMFCNLSCSTS
jgi:hypothetical protein